VHRVDVRPLEATQGRRPPVGAADRVDDPPVAEEKAGKRPADPRNGITNADGEHDGDDDGDDRDPPRTLGGPRNDAVTGGAPRPIGLVGAVLGGAISGVLHALALGTWPWPLLAWVALVPLLW